ncbi:putative magnesium transporter NIPA4 [Hibiscus syriacus]|uniref:Probable magnesium transporter n=1 Tax=Hibiscus syriacus TaxID=106335 RepID=A0A6A3AP78_HIBSY|nr:putative magnesium transporter NIPA4 [Hibiscus syriacus]
MSAVRRWSEGMSSDNVNGLVLAISSSLFIRASFIFKKKCLKIAGASGVRAGVGGYSYLLEPLWWAGMITMVVGEIANFAAYAFSPAILVTLLGALSIIIRHANLSLKFRHTLWFTLEYALSWVLFRYASGQVMSVKALGIALKLTCSRMNQLVYPQTWAFTLVVVTYVITQMNYLNKALDTFNTTVVSPIYYVMFTELFIHYCYSCTAAIQCLKRKRLYEQQIEQLGNFQLRIHDQMIMLECAKATTETVDALRIGAAVMKAMQKAMNIDDVDKTMDEMRTEIC